VEYIIFADTDIWTLYFVTYTKIYVCNYFKIYYLIIILIFLMYVIN